MIGVVGEGGGCTINCTINVCVLCLLLKAILLVYVPGLRFVIFTLTAVIVRLFPWSCPLAGVLVNQLAYETAFQLTVPEQLGVALRLNEPLLGLP